MEVPFFRYSHVFEQHRQAVLQAVTDTASRGAFILQDEVAEFERKAAEFAGANHGVGVSNATDGLLIALHAAGIGSGDEVIFASHTYIATAAAIHYSGATPVPVDCGPDHLMNPAAAAAAVTQRTRAIIPTQLNGRTCDMAALGVLAERHNLIIVEDAAQALGSRFRGRAAGTFGMAGAISFYPAKVLGCLGDGGLLLTNDGAAASTLRQLRDHGRDEGGTVRDWGYNARLDNLQAAVLLAKWADYPAEIERRRAIARRYGEQLAGLDDLTLPPGPDSDADHFDIFQNYEVEADCRNSLREHLKENGIDTILQWGGTAVHQFPFLEGDWNLPATDRLFARCFLLPMNTSLADDEVDYICGVIRDFFGA